MRRERGVGPAAGNALMKQAAAAAALEAIEPLLTRDAIVGVGTGSTANLFIAALAAVRHKFDAAVSSSQASTERLRAHGIAVLDLNAVPAVAVYVDGADAADPSKALVKGGGGALTREKIVAAAAETFLCIVDASKCVRELGGFPVAVEVIPMARGLVARELAALGGRPVYRQGFVTDNGNVILDVHGLALADPDGWERQVNNMVGVVANGVFAANRPDALLVGTESGVERR